MERVPVSIVTGALGSGKTTLLNYLLTEHHGIRIGVIVNEFGDVGIDSKLIEASDDDIIELPNGCVCCTVRGDLIAAVGKTLERDVTYILVETSGMASPGPVANTFLAPELPVIRQRCKLDGIITIVDAEHFFAAHGSPAEEQVQAADVVLLNKTDLVPEEQLALVEARIRELSPRTYVFRTVRGRAPLHILLATGKFDLDRWIAEGHDTEAHDHAAGFEAISVEQSASLKVDAVSAYLRSIPPGIFRAKGVLCIGNLADPRPEKDSRMVFQKVGKRIETHFGRGWKDGEEHVSRIVLIGKDLDREMWQKGLDGCVLTQGAR